MTYTTGFSKICETSLAPRVETRAGRLVDISNVLLRIYFRDSSTGSQKRCISVVWTTVWRQVPIHCQSLSRPVCFCCLIQGHIATPINAIQFYDREVFPLQHGNSVQEDGSTLRKDTLYLQWRLVIYGLVTLIKIIHDWSNIHTTI
jgi:hypothetical protein